MMYSQTLIRDKIEHMIDIVIIFTWKILFSLRKIKLNPVRMGKKEGSIFWCVTEVIKEEICQASFTLIHTIPQQPVTLPFPNKTSVGA